MTQDLAIIALSAFAAGLLRGFTGFGFALAAVPLLSLWLPPLTAVTAVLMLQVSVGLVDAPRVMPKADWRGLAPILVAMAVTTPFGLAILGVVGEDAARIAIAATLAVAVALIAIGRDVPRPAARWGPVVVGAASGLFNGIAAMPGPPVIAWYLASGLPREKVRVSLMSYFALASSVGLGFAVAKGLVGRQEALTAAIGLLPMLAGNHLGGRLFGRAGETTYRRVALLTLAALAVITLVRAVA